MYLVDSKGNQVAAYTYDPYGKVLTATGTMAELNPLRYRGYYQDSETGFYYLQSRYYDPAICRFINADSYASTGQGLIGYNAFAYCNNNPASYIDSEGERPLAIFDYYWIHKEVQIACCNGSGWKMEIYVKNGDRRGFLDLYNPVTNEYFEVKSDHYATVCFALTEKQMYFYDFSTVRSKRVPDAIGRTPTRGVESLSGHFTYDTYDVTYQKSANGLITYTITPNHELLKQERKALVCTLSLITVTYMLSCGVGSGSRGYFLQQFGE